MPISREFNGGGYCPRRAAIQKASHSRRTFYAAQDSICGRESACGRDGAEAWTPTNIALWLILIAALIALVPCGCIIACCNPAEPRQTTRAICSADKRPVGSIE
jgi:hypothetical protein